MTNYEKLFNATTDKVEHYRTDFDIDKKTLEHYPDFPFIHVAREMGTHLHIMFPSTHPEWPEAGISVSYLFGRANRERMLESTMANVEYTCKDPSNVIHYLENGELTKVTGEQAIEIWRTYIKQVKTEWEA